VSDNKVAPQVLAHPGTRPTEKETHWSGKDGASLRHPPLRTVRAGFLAHGSSKSLRIRRFSCRRCCCVDLLVAVEVYKLQVGVLIRPAFAFGV
jgi:hypothetical protein